MVLAFWGGVDIERSQELIFYPTFVDAPLPNARTPYPLQTHAFQTHAHTKDTAPDTALDTLQTRSRHVCPRRTLQTHYP